MTAMLRVRYVPTNIHLKTVPHKLPTVHEKKRGGERKSTEKVIGRPTLYCETSLAFQCWLHLCVLYEREIGLHMVNKQGHRERKLYKRLFLRRMKKAII